MHKIVYNAKCGSFHLSDIAFNLYKKYGGKTIFNNSFIRHDPILIKVVEELGDKVNTDLTDIKIAEISGNKYRIEDNYGAEKVVEPEEKTYIIIDEDKKILQKTKPNEYQLKDFKFTGFKTNRNDYIPIAYTIDYEKDKNDNYVPYIKTAILLKDTEINGIIFNFGNKLEDIIDILYSEKSVHRRNNIYFSICNNMLSILKKEEK